MLGCLIVWIAASFIFVKLFNYPVDACLTGFFIMSGFGLLIEHKNHTIRMLGKLFGKLSEYLKGYSKNKEESSNE